MNLFLSLAYLFFIGSVLGWILELFFRKYFSGSNPEHKWINPGFCTGPYVPLYGFGLCILYLLVSLGERVSLTGSTGGHCAACPGHGSMYDRDRVYRRDYESEGDEGTSLGLLKALGKHKRPDLPAVFVDLGRYGGSLLFSGSLLRPAFADMAGKQPRFLFRGWTVFLRVSGRRRLFHPFCDTLEALCRGTRRHREI